MPRLRLAALLVLAASPAGAGATAQPPLRYRAALRAPGDSLLQISLTLPAPLARGVDFVMPNAVPMGYGANPYDRFVVGLAGITPAGARLVPEDIDGPRWRFPSGPEAPLAAIHYAVNLAAMDREILSAGDASRVRPRFVGLLGYATFGYVEGTQFSPAEVRLVVPAGWPAFTTLASGVRTDSVTAAATGFYHLADAQYLGGPDLRLLTPAAPVPLTVAVYAEGAFDTDTLAVLAARALRATTDYFGSAPFPRYTVSFESLRPVSPAHGYRFSMEHLESATFRFEAGATRMNGDARTRFYYNLLHHIAHAWIPKRCAPAGYYPFVWDDPVPIDGIWFSEGWAQYLAADMLARDPAFGPTAARALIAFRFDAATDSAPPIAGRTVPELSRIAAFRYSDDFRLSAHVFSRGALMAAAIDERIRSRTGGRQDLRGVARALLTWCAQSSAPVTEVTLNRLVAETTGVDVADLIDAGLAARGTRPGDRPRP
ncbi:MAG: hypothetical protein AB7S39_00700 [Gemmatimonadales bacterium]